MRLSHGTVISYVVRVNLPLQFLAFSIVFKCENSNMLSFAERNPCDSNPCIFGTCNKTSPTTYSCECIPGYQGRNCGTGMEYKSLFLIFIFQTEAFNIVKFTEGMLYFSRSEYQKSYS